MNLDLHLLSAYALPIANVLLLGAAALTIVRVLRHMRAESSRATQSPSDMVYPEILALSQSCKLIATQLAAMQAKVDRISNLDQLLADPGSRPMPLERATRLAQTGASAEELAQSCGLSIGEAQLMRRLHRHNGPPQ